MRTLLALATLASLVTPLTAQQPDSTTLAGLRWRTIGPANHQGRVVDVQGIPWPSRTFYVSSAGGGLFKTTNAGTTFRAVFDTGHVSSGGMIAIASTDTNTVYYGTGEPNSRNSMSPGNGVWKSADGGRSWQAIGLKETQHIGRIVVDPRNKDVAYVAALGHAWGPNRERGLFKTTDGGKTWANLKYINDSTGFVDVALDPRNPDVVWAASYQRIRGPYFLYSGGKGSALWKSADAGATWAEVKGGGFPETAKGRISIAIALSNPDVMYTMVEADTSPNPKKDPAVKAQKFPSGLFRSADGGRTWTRMNDENTRPFYYSQVRVDPTNADHVFWSSTPLKYSRDGGKTAGNTTIGVHVDHHAMWIDPKDPSHIIVGNDGGVAQSWDGGGNWVSLNSLPIGQYYNVSVDMAIPYSVCGGAQDNGSWCAPSRRKQRGVTNAMWFTFAGGDGFHTAQDPVNPDIIYGESQGGNIARYVVSTGERVPLVKPAWRPRYTQWEDSVLVYRPDTAKPMTSAERRHVDSLRMKQRKDSMDLDLRWNWNTPFFISPHNHEVLYFGANRVLKSTRMGDAMYPISPDLSYADTMKARVSMRTTGGITTDATGAETFGTVVSLTESPVRPGILFAGTDDGRLWVTWNDGAVWTELTANVKGVPAGTYVSRIEPSHFDTLTCYVTFDNHRRDDFRPYVFATSDGGRTFRSIAANLPTGGPDYVYVIREDPKNRSVLFIGTDVGAYASFDRGASWQRFMTGLPTVPVMDLVVHPRDGELVAATHGRGFWIVDITPLQQWTAQIAGKPAHLFKPRTAFQWGEPAFEGQSAGQQTFEAPSPSYGAEIVYRLAERAQGQVRVIIQDAGGDTLASLVGGAAAGINRVTWNFRGKNPPSPSLSPAGKRDSAIAMRQILNTLDSLEMAASVPKAILDRVRGAIAQGPGAMQDLVTQFAGAFGGSGPAAFGGPVRFNERAGETPPVAPGGPGGAAPAAAAQGEGAAAGGGAGAVQPSQNQLMELFRAMSGGGRNLAVFGAGAPPTSLMGTGDYLVTLSVGGQAQKQVLRVERASGTGLAAGPFQERPER